MDDLVLETIVRYCTTKTQARLLCVNKRFHEVVKRVIEIHGLRMTLTPQSYKDIIAWSRPYYKSVTSCIASRVPIWMVHTMLMPRLHTLRLCHTKINIRDMAYIARLQNLQYLELHALRRCYHQDDRFYLSSLPKKLTRVTLTFDDSWTCITLDGTRDIQCLSIQCRDTLIRIRNAAYASLEYLSLSSHQKIHVSPDVRAMAMSRVKSVYLSSPKTESSRFICLLFGPAVQRFVVLLPNANFFFDLMVTIAGINPQVMRVHGAMVMYNRRPTKSRYISIIADTFMTLQSLRQPESLFCDQRCALDTV